jgi:hypothetical protein
VDTLRKPGAIEGRVTSAHYKLRGVTAYVPGTSYNAHTDSTGAFLIGNIPAGDYPVAFLHSMLLDTLLGTVSVTPGDTVRIKTVKLRKDPVRFPGTISGFVRDDLGRGVSGVAVTSNPKGYTTTTIDSTGAFTMPGVIPGTYRIAFHHECYADSFVESVAVDFDESVDSVGGTVTRKPNCFKGSVSGWVRDTAGDGSEGVEVVLKDSSGNVADSETDSTGVYRLTSVLGGTYRMLFRQGAFRDTSLGNVAFGIEENVDSLDMVLHHRPESLRVDIPVMGSLSGATKAVARTEAAVYGDFIAETAPLTRDMTWKKKTRAYR